MYRYNTEYYELFCFENHRSSYWRCSVKEDALKNFANFTRKHLYWKYLFNKAPGLQVYNFIKKSLCDLRNFEEHLF